MILLGDNFNDVLKYYLALLIIFLDLPTFSVDITVFS